MGPYACGATVREDAIGAENVLCQLQDFRVFGQGRDRIGFVQEVPYSLGTVLVEQSWEMQKGFVNRFDGTGPSGHHIAVSCMTDPLHETV